MVNFSASSNVSDYLLGVKKGNMKCQITDNTKLIGTFPINTNQLPCKWIHVST